jgi:thiamine biosynthesis lipoprotein ApbE
MTARGKFWLCSFILGFALGILVFYILGRSGPAHQPAPTSQKQPYQVEPFREAVLEGGNLKEFTQEAKQLGTTILLKAHASDRAAVVKAFRAAFDRIHEIELMMSPYRPDSPLSQINASGKGKGYQVPEELGRVIAASLDLCSRTGGALDITVRPLIAAYKSAEARKRAPTQMEISAALARVGYKKVSMSEDLCTLTIADDGIALDLSATAKGYAADEGAKVLRENGIEHAYVPVSGTPGTPKGKKASTCISSSLQTARCVRAETTRRATGWENREFHILLTRAPASPATGTLQSL